MKQSDAFGSHIFIEIITRAISKLDLLVYPKSFASNHASPDCFHGVLKAWTDHPNSLVDVLEFKDSKIGGDESSFKVVRRGDSDLSLTTKGSDVDYEKVLQEIMKNDLPFESKTLE